MSDEWLIETSKYLLDKYPDITSNPMKYKTELIAYIKQSAQNELLEIENILIQFYQYKLLIEYTHSERTEDNRDFWMCLCDIWAKKLISRCNEIPQKQFFKYFTKDKLNKLYQDAKCYAKLEFYDEDITSEIFSAPANIPEEWILKKGKQKLGG